MNRTQTRERDGETNDQNQTTNRILHTLTLAIARGRVVDLFNVARKLYKRSENKHTLR